MLYELQYVREYSIEQFKLVIVGAQGRKLLSHAIQAAVFNLNYEAIATLLDLIKYNQVLAHISPSNVKALMYGQEYQVIAMLINSSIQLRVPFKTKSKQLQRMITSVWETQSV